MPEARVGMLGTGARLLLPLIGLALAGWERLPGEVRGLLRRTGWVADAEVRMRKERHIFLGEAFVVPRLGTGDLVPRLGEAAEQATALDWRVHGLAAVPVEQLP